MKKGRKSLIEGIDVFKDDVFIYMYIYIYMRAAGWKATLTKTEILQARIA